MAYILCDAYKWIDCTSCISFFTAYSLLPFTVLNVGMANLDLLIPKTDVFPGLRTSLILIDPTVLHGNSYLDNFSGALSLTPLSELSHHPPPLT
jgi:hypothetical protein